MKKRIILNRLLAGSLIIGTSVTSCTSKKSTTASTDSTTTSTTTTITKMSKVGITKQAWDKMDKPSG